MYNFSSKPQTNGKGFLPITISTSITTQMNNEMLTYNIDDLVRQSQEYQTYYRNFALLKIHNIAVITYPDDNANTTPTYIATDWYENIDINNIKNWDNTKIVYNDFKKIKPFYFYPPKNPVYSRWMNRYNVTTAPLEGKLHIFTEGVVNNNIKNINKVEQLKKDIDNDIHNKKFLDLSVSAEQHEFKNNKKNDHLNLSIDSANLIIKAKPKHYKNIATETPNACVNKLELLPFPPVEKQLDMKTNYFNKKISKANDLANCIMNAQYAKIEEQKHLVNDLKNRVDQEKEKYDRRFNFEKNQISKELARERMKNDMHLIFKENEDIKKLQQMILSGKWDKNAKIRKTQIKILDTLVEYEKTQDSKRRKEIELAIAKWITM